MCARVCIWESLGELRLCVFVCVCNAKGFAAPSHAAVSFFGMSKNIFPHSLPACAFSFSHVDVLRIPDLLKASWGGGLMIEKRYFIAPGC